MMCPSMNYLSIVVVDVVVVIDIVVVVLSSMKMFRVRIIDLHLWHLRVRLSTPDGPDASNSLFAKLIRNLQ